MGAHGSQDGSHGLLDRSVSRRQFVKSAAAAAGVLTIVPRHVLGGPRHVPPSDKINIACIGVGSQGTRVMLEFLRQRDAQITAVCDCNEGCDDYQEWGRHEIRDKVRKLLDDPNWATLVDGALAGRKPAQEIVNRYYARQQDRASYSGCTAYADYRELLAKEKGLDAVVVCTPDHAHAIISIAAMRAGKHVYCQKPMTHTVAEARQMAQVARETKVATQVATGNAASEATRTLSEWVAAGAIGPVREVHNWSSRPFWPQGIERPLGEQPVPDYLNWDLWLGPAPRRPYSAIYQPFVWRGWFDFGTGAIGDMGPYSFDTIFRVLKLTAPSQVEASSTKVFPETFPAASIVRLHFPARQAMPPVTVHWYDGGLKPPRPAELGNQELEAEGMLFVGARGKILCGFSGGRPRLIPDSAMKAFSPPPHTLPRSIGHNPEWLAACKGGPAPAANFEFAGPVTEAFLLGNVALRTGKTITWDAEKMAVTNDRKANELLSMPYREG